MSNGLRGVTNQDVANVARRGYVSVDPRAGGLPTTRTIPTQTLPSLEDVFGRLYGTPINTAGQKYSGYPTATAERTAVLGMLEPFYALGDLASQLAGREYGDIVSSIESPYGQGSFTDDDGKLRTYANAPIAMPGVDMGVAPARVAAGNELDPAYQAAELAKNQAWRDVATANLFGRPANVDAARQAEADLALASRNATSARLAQATGAAAQGAERYRTDVVPQADFASDIASVPRYELARQIATQYFGMDPALAYGTFTPEVDTDYMKMMRDLQTQQNLARGIDPTATVADTLLALDPTGQDLLDYQKLMAQQAALKLQEGLNTAAEDAFDADLESKLGIDINTAAGDLPRSTARGWLNNAKFVGVVKASVKAMQDTRDLGGNTSADYIAQIARDYVVNQNGDPIAAVILQNILASFEFLPGEL